MSESGCAIQPNAATMPMKATAVGSGELALPRSGAETQPFASRLRWLVSFPAMLGAFLIGVVFSAMRLFRIDGDLWSHTKNGLLILSTHHWPTADPYSFTVNGQPWITCEWAGEILLAAVSRLGGVLGLDILQIILGSAVMIALYYLGTLRSGNSKAGFVATILLAPLAMLSFTLRPQVLGYLFLVFAMIALESFRQGKRRAIWLLPPLMLVWVNTHGSFIIGLGAIFIYWIAGLREFELGGIVAKAWTPSERRQISFVFLLCLAVLPITPYGTQIAMYPFQVAFHLPLGVANVSEWFSMPFHDPAGKLFLAIVLGFFLVQVVYRLCWRLEELVLFLFGVVAACVHVRFVMLFVPFCVPVLATIFARWVPRYDRAKDQYALNLVLIAALTGAMFWFRPTQAKIQEIVARSNPVGALQYMRQHKVQGPLFNSYNFGGYLLWAGEKVFVDGRADPYERGGSLADYFYIATIQPGALKVLKNYGIRACLMEQGAPLNTLLATQPDWQKAYSDHTSVLFVRRNTSLNADTAAATRK